MPSSPLPLQGDSGNSSASSSSSTPEFSGTERSAGRARPLDQAEWYAPPDLESIARAGGRRTSLVCPYDDEMHYEPRVETHGMSIAELVACEDVYSRDFAELAMIVRVLSNGLDPDMPLLDRFNFLCIVSVLLDEHFVQRLGAIEQTDPADFRSFRMALKKSIRPRIPHDVKLDGAIRAVIRDQYAALTKDVIPGLRERGVYILAPEELSAGERERATSYFNQYVRHALTPFVVDQTHPFPEVSSHSIYMCVMLCPVSAADYHNSGGILDSAEVNRGIEFGASSGISAGSSIASAKTGREYVPRTPPPSVGHSTDSSSLDTLGRPRRVFLKVPHGMKRLVPLDASGKKMIAIERLIEMHIPEVCRGMHVFRAHMFRVTRNVKLELAEFSSSSSMFTNAWTDPEPNTDLWDAVQSETHRRRFAPPTRLETLCDFPADLQALLLKELVLDESDVFVADGDLLDLSGCMSLSFLDLPDLRVVRKEPKVPKRFQGIAETLPTDPGKIFRVIKERDVLIEHPRDSFEGSTLLFLAAAARDPQVRSLKVVIYRAGSNSPLIHALERAAKNGKEVTALVELKASFDEVLNCEYATRLQKAGCNVIYGVLGLKVHSKIMLAVRTEDNGVLTTYCNISTGNFNHKTSRLYTDCSLMTARQLLCADMHDVFNSLSGLSHSRDFRQALVAPYNMMNMFSKLVQEEARYARAGLPARIVAQVNGLSDVQIIRDLYEASQAGVKIDLFVRVACRLRPGLKGKSENIRVFSWVGPVLQHRRIFYYYANGEEKTFMGSADWRTRNLNNRTEVAVPIYDKTIKQRLQKILVSMKDERYLWQLFPDNRYYKISALPNPVEIKIAPPTQWSSLNRSGPSRKEDLFRSSRQGGGGYRDSGIQSEVICIDESYPDRDLMVPQHIGKPQRRTVPTFASLDASSGDTLSESVSPSGWASPTATMASRSGSFDRATPNEKENSRTTPVAHSVTAPSAHTRSRQRPRPKVNVTVNGNQISVDKIEVAAVPVLYESTTDVSAVQVLMVQRSGDGNAWSVPKDGIKNSTEPHEEAAVRVVREKGGVFRAEHTGPLGWIVRESGNKSIAVSTFIVRVVDGGNFATSVHTRNRQWMPLVNTIALARASGNRFTRKALESAYAALKDEFDMRANSLLALSLSSPTLASASAHQAYRADAVANVAEENGKDGGSLLHIPPDSEHHLENKREGIEVGTKYPGRPDAEEETKGYPDIRTVAAETVVDDDARVADDVLAAETVDGTAAVATEEVREERAAEQVETAEASTVAGIGTVVTSSKGVVVGNSKWAGNGRGGGAGSN